MATIIIDLPPPRRIRRENANVVDVRYGVPMFRPVPIQQEPKRNNRFIVEFPEIFQIESFLVQNSTKPTLILKNSKYHWKNIDIEFIDVIGPSTTRCIMNMVEFYKNNKKKWFQKKRNILFEFNLKLLDPVGVVIEHWQIQVEQLLMADFGHCDYHDDGIQKCKIRLKPYNCILIE